MRSLLSLRKSFHHILRGNVQRKSMSYKYTIPGEHHVTNNNSNTSLGVRCRTTRFARSASETKASLPETPGSRGKSGAAPSASSSGAFPQFGPTPRQFLLRQCPADMFEDVSIDGSNIDDAFTDGGIWDQASVRRPTHDCQRR